MTNLPQILEILALAETTKLLTGFLGTSGVNAMQIATVEKEQGVENVIQTMQREIAKESIMSFKHAMSSLVHMDLVAH